MRVRAFWCAVIAVLSFGCAHTGTLSTPSGNHLSLGNHGLNVFPGRPVPCPMGTGDGEVLKSWDTGKKRVRGQCLGGLMVGEWKAWYQNGALEWTATFSGGLMVGVFHSFFANDQQRAKVMYRDGFPEGEAKLWHFGGKVAAKGSYVGGRKNGCWEEWHPNGEKASKGTWADDRQVATWLYWTLDGTRRKEKLGGEPLHGECLLTL